MARLLATLLWWSALDALAAPPAYDPAHGVWDRLLATHVAWNAAGTATAVDYAGFARDAEMLERYLQSLATVDASRFRQWPLDEREALLINAYNAATVQLVLTRYPDLDSIRELGWRLRPVWKRAFISLLGEVRSLDDIEHGLLRGDPGHADPRIHFAVNCASVGCPALRPEAYLGARLRGQLEDQTRRFLRDRSRNRLAGGILRVSRIFDWYRGDFAARGGVRAFLAAYAGALDLDSRARGQLLRGKIRLAYRDYDWSLNRSRP